jgi:hypothetical protein
VPQEPHKARPAITVIAGLAVCDDHMGYVHHDAINFAIQEDKQSAQQGEPK